MKKYNFKIKNSLIVKIIENINPLTYCHKDKQFKFMKEAEVLKIRNLLKIPQNKRFRTQKSFLFVNGYFSQF